MSIKGDLPHADDRGRPTLRTVAALSGVHVSTVSRVLAGNGARSEQAASARTAGRIREIAKEVGYAPNAHATGLRTSRSQLIGVLVPHLTDLVLATIYQGIEDAGRDHGYNTIVTNSGNDTRARTERVEMLLARGVDGLILGDSPIEDGLAQSLANREIPYMLVSRRSGNHPAVTCDDVLGGELAARHLLSLGHHHAGIIAGEAYASTGLDRTKGFSDAYERAGFPIEANRIMTSGFDVEAGYRTASVLLQLPSPPTALFAVNDFAAIGIFRALREQNLEAGRDVAVVGFNDVSIAGALPIPLTTVRSPMRAMGQQALELLLDTIKGTAVRSRALAPELIIRESTTR